jgi:thymidylate kinase
MIIIFTGTIRSGKSTQKELLAHKLRSEGFLVKSTFLQSGHGLAYLLQILLARTLLKRKYLYEVEGLIYERRELFRKLFKLWLFLDCVSILILYLIRIYIPERLGRVILVEGYIPSTLVDYMYIFKRLKRPMQTVNFLNRLTKILIRITLCSTYPLIAVYLHANDDTLKRRWKGKEDLNLHSEYIQLQRTKLLSFLKHACHSFIILRTDSRSIKDTHSMIMNFLNKVLDINDGQVDRVS